MLYVSVIGPKNPRKRFFKPIRADIVKLVIDGGRTSPDVAKKYNIPIATVYCWVRQARSDAGDVASRSGANYDRTEIARLKGALKTASKS